MHVLLVVSRLTGHHVSLYLDKILGEFARREWDATVVGPTGMKSHPLWRELEQPHACFRVLELPSTSLTSALHSFDGPIIEAISQVLAQESLRRLSSIINNQLDGVFFTSLDHASYGLALRHLPFGSTPIAGIQTRTRFLQSGRLRHRIARCLFARLGAKDQFRAVAVLTPDSARVLRRNFRSKGVLVKVIPEARREPFPRSRDEARGRYGLHERSVVVLLYGSLSMRKGVRELVQAATLLGDTDLKILIAGQPDDETRDYLLQSREASRLRRLGSLQLELGFKDANEVADLFSAVDAVWLGYPNDYQGSSGVLEEAIAYRKVVIGTTKGMIGQRVRDLDLGWTAAPEDATAVRDALSALLRSPRRAPDRELIEANSRATFEKEVCDLMVEAFPAPHAGETRE